MNKDRYQDWIAEEWASVDVERVVEAEPHWNKFQWVGDHGRGLPPSVQAADMPEGEEGLSGHRHTPAPAHWAPSS